MKKTGTGNRFSLETRCVWLYWYSCMFCGKNQQDILHHIICKSVRFYVDGDHNESVYNSAPLHNFVCHIGNESWLYNEENLKMLLKKTRSALRDMAYVPDDKDRKFLSIYSKLYE